MRYLTLIFLVLCSIVFTGCSEQVSEPLSSTLAKVQTTSSKEVATSVKLLPAKIAVTEVSNIWKVFRHVYKDTIQVSCGRAQMCPETRLRYTAGGTMMVLESPIKNQEQLVFFDGREDLSNTLKASDKVCISYTEDNHHSVEVKYLILKDEPNYAKECSSNNG